jgi:hypothetical protein
VKYLNTVVTLLPPPRPPPPQKKERKKRNINYAKLKFKKNIMFLRFPTITKFMKNICAMKNFTHEIIKV